MLRKRDLAVSRIVIIGMSIAWKMAKLSFTDVDGKGFSMVGKTNGSIPNGERPPGPLTILICRIGCTSIYRNEKKGAPVIGHPLRCAVLRQYSQADFLDEKRFPRQKPSQHSTLFLVFEIFAECCDGLDVAKGLSFLHSEGRADEWVAEGLAEPRDALPRSPLG